MVRCVIALLIVGRYRTCRNRWGMPQGQQVAQRQCDQGHGPRADTGWRDRRVPNEGEHDIMRSAMDPGTHSASPGRLLPLVPALALFSMVSGCAGWSSLGEYRTGLSGRVLEPSRQDRRGAGLRPLRRRRGCGSSPGGKASQLASKDAKDRHKSATNEEPAPDLVAQEDATRSPGRRGSKKRAKTGDTSIRVTLGRPESLPTLKDPAEAGGPMLASAAATNWKRGNSAEESESAPTA